MSNEWQKLKINGYKLTRTSFDIFRQSSIVETKEGLR